MAHRSSSPAVLLRAAGVVAATALIITTPALSTVSRRAPALNAQPAGTEAATLPDTAAARVAKGFLAMVNDGTEKAVVEFEGAHASASRRGSVEISERVRRIAQLKEEWGVVRIGRVLASSANSLTVSVIGARAGAMEMEFQMSAAEAGKFDGVMIMAEGAGANRPKPEAVTAAQVSSVAEAACAALEKSYVFPEIAQKMCESVRAKVKAGEYAAVKDEMELARRLTDDFRAVSKDKHLRVNFAPDMPAASGAPAHTGVGLPDLRSENYAFRKVEVLPGNIGYIRFDAFVEDAEANKVASAAMNFLANTDAIVFDMRYNGGGSPEMIRYITSYLFEKPTHLNNMVDREGTVLEEYWTLGEVPGARPALDTPVFVLTSGRTFSGAEEFSYNLKNLKRGTIVGETTGGGAHPVMGERLSSRFTIGVPFMRANNPISKTNWEGTGVEPDIKTTASEALDRALVEARKAIAGRRK